MVDTFEASTLWYLACHGIFLTFFFGGFMTSINVNLQFSDWVSWPQKLEPKSTTLFQRSLSDTVTLVSDSIVSPLHLYYSAQEIKSKQEKIKGFIKWYDVRMKHNRMTEPHFIPCEHDVPRFIPCDSERPRRTPGSPCGAFTWEPSLQSLTFERIGSIWRSPTLEIFIGGYCLGLQSSNIGIIAALDMLRKQA